MKKIFVITFMLMINNIFAQNAGDSKSIKALRMDKYPESSIGTLEIQLDLKKVVLKEYDKTPEPAVTDTDKKNGYIIFFRNYQSVVYPFNKPAKEEIAKREVKIFASLGEYEPITFSIYPLTRLTGCKISVSDYVNESGQKITKDAFQINNLMNCPVGVDLISVRSYVLIPSGEVPLIEEKVCKQIWINVKVPEDAKEGTYKGNVTFSPLGKPATIIPVEIRVLPFKLMQPPDVTWGPSWGDGAWDFNKLEKRLIMLKDHGMTGEVYAGLGAEGTDYTDFTKANKYMEMAKKVGLTGKFVLGQVYCGGGYSSYKNTPGPFGTKGDTLFCQSTYDKIEDIIRKTRDNAEKNKWLPYMFCLSYELGSSNGTPGDFEKMMKKSEEYYAAARKVERVKLLAIFNRQEEFMLHWGLPTLDEFGLLGVKMSSEVGKAAKNKPLWFGAKNIRSGFYMWKFNIKGTSQYLYGKPLGSVPDEDGTLMHIFNNEYVASIVFENSREGVDDYKYCYTLAEYIKQAKAKGQDTKQTEKILSGIMDKIPNNYDYWDTSKNKDSDYTQLDDFRREIAEQILKLVK